MDRRNLQRVGTRNTGNVQTGLMSGIPAAGSPGRVYIVTKTLTATAASGHVKPIAFVDSGTDWTAADTTIFQTNRVITITGTLQRSMLAGGITSTGTRTKPMLAARMLASGYAIDTRFLVAPSATGALTVTFRLKYGTATVVKKTQSPGAGTQKFILRFGLRAYNNSTCQVQATYEVMATGGSLVTQGSAGSLLTTTTQAFDITAQQNLNGVSTGTAVHYVMSTWHQ